jgi:hypothetical protein
MPVPACSVACVVKVTPTADAARVVAPAASPFSALRRLMANGSASFALLTLFIYAPFSFHGSNDMDAPYLLRPHCAKVGKRKQR